MNGKYIVLEGGEYVGKSTQTRLLATQLGAELVYEPGFTDIGREVRSILLQPNRVIHPKTEVLLHAAQRAELAETVIRPSLESGHHVVSDRSWVSSAAYQGAQGVEFNDILRVNSYALDSLLQPDIIILLDAEPSAVLARRGNYLDRYEQADISFHEKVRNNFLEVAQAMGAVIIDATLEVTEVSSQIRNAVHQRLSI